jgi:ketosteroid isomerase-like protein
MAVTNRQLVQAMTEAFLKGDIATVQDYWADNIVWYFPGRSMLAGVFHGKEDILKHLSPPSRGSFELKPQAFSGDTKYGVALYELTSTRNGKSLIETRVMVCNIDNGKVVETRIYPGDQYALDKFWS